MRQVKKNQIKFGASETLYHIISNRFEGYIELKFDDSGNVMGIDFSNSSVSIEQQKWFLQHLPTNIDALEIYTEFKDTITVREINRIKEF